MTVEAAYTKLSFLLGCGLPLEEVKNLMGENLRGELTRKQHTKKLLTKKMTHNLPHAIIQ